MAEYTLKVNGFGKVRYVMKQAGANVMAEMDEAKALEMLARGEARESGEVEGFGVTADGVYFFEREVDTSSEPPKAAHIPLKGKALECGDGVEIGADGLPMPAGDGEKKRRGRRVKDEVCQ